MLNWDAESIREMIKVVMDPELGINIVDLGLVYEVDVTPEKDVNVVMTLTSPGCPIGPQLTREIQEVLQDVPGINKVNVEFVWTPRWDPHVHPTEDGKLELGIW